MADRHFVFLFAPHLSFPVQFVMLSSKTRPFFHTLLDALSLQDGDETAIIYIQSNQPSHTISRRAFRAAVMANARALRVLGVQPHDLIIIAHTQNVESITLFWGAMAVGAIPSMFPTLTEKLDTAVYMQNMAQLTAFSDVRAILTTDEFAPMLQTAVSCPVYGSSQIDHDGDDGQEWMFAPAADDIAFLQHSSGTTGLQKGVALTQTAVLNQLASYSDALALTADDVVVSWLPLYHDMGLIAGFLLPLIQGIPLVLMSPFDWVRHPALLFQAIDTHGGTLCWLPNFAYNHCARRIRPQDVDGLSLDSMRLFINCSEPVRADSHAQFLDKFSHMGLTTRNLAVSYAMAENTFAVTQTPAGQPVRLDVIDGMELSKNGRAAPSTPDSKQAVSHVSCGRAIAETKIIVLDESHRPLPDRHVGEIGIQSNCLLAEYHHRPDLQPFTSDGFYLTGDRGYLADGELYIIGRTKDLIINAGKNVYPQDIEAIVNAVEGVKNGRAVVFGVQDEREGTELIAVVAEVLTEDVATRKKINKAIRQAVATHSTVTASYVQLVDEKWILKTSSGKLARAANRDKWLAERKG